MRRLPIYFLVDVSESMVGTPIEQVQDGMAAVITELRSDPYALETAFVSVIAFAGKPKMISPLQELYMFYPPKLPIGGGTSLGAALNFLMDEMDSSLQKTTLEVKGDWKPIVFLFTDGTPTDDYQAAFARWNSQYRSQCNLVAISLGNNLDTSVLGQISDNVLQLTDTDVPSFKAFFKWVTASIKTSSVSVSDAGDDSLKLASTQGLNLEKVNGKKSVKVDENFVVLHGKCQTTGKSYLVKYVKDLRPSEYAPYDVLYYKLVGAWPIDGEAYLAMADSSATNRKINTEELRGMPTCPCCGNQLGVVVCNCGNIFCAGENIHNQCPWCGMEGELGRTGEGGVDIARTRG